MVAAGQAAVPFVSWDGIQDGSGADHGSFIQTAGPAAAGSYFSHASFASPKFDFVDSLSRPVRHGSRRIRGGRLRVHPGHPRQSAGGRRDRAECRRSARSGPGLRGRPGQPIRHRHRHRRLRRERRLAPAVRHLLQGRHVRRRREGRLGHRQAAGLRPGPVGSDTSAGATRSFAEAAVECASAAGAWLNGRAPDSGSGGSRFESWRASQLP